MSSISKAILLSSLLFLGCERPLTAIEAGSTGAFLGAGTGAIIGAAISNGDVLRSTGLGAAVGFPAGIVVNEVVSSIPGLVYPVKKDHSEEILANQKLIYRRSRELDELRAEVRSEAPENVDFSQRQYVYLGPSRGNRYR